VSAGKADAEKTRQAREAQKKAVAEASVIIANNDAKKTPSAQSASEDTNTIQNILNTTQWMTSVLSFH